MNRLSLAQRLASEATGSTGPTSTLNQTYESGRLVNWIDDAYRHVQTLFTNWQFLRRNFTFHTLPHIQTYDKVTIPLPELSLWIPDTLKVYKTAAGVGTEIELQYWNWDDFRRIYLYGANQLVENMPVYFTIKPDKSLMFWPTPEADYTISGEYYMRAQKMLDDDDEPVFAEEYQLIIVWWALQLYAGFANASEKYATGKEQYGIILQKLTLDQLPEVKLAGPLV
jgi:hypothetical protein